MKTKSTTAFSAAIPIPELLDKHNYSEWVIRVQTYLKGQDLWKVIIDKNENAPAYENDDDDGADDDAAVATINVCRRRNYMALHVIQISCGPDAFAEIRSIRSAKTAWQTLEKKYLIVPDTGNVERSYFQYADLYMAVRHGHWTAAREFLDSQPDAVRKTITNKGETALHIAITAGHTDIVHGLVDRMLEDHGLGIEDEDGDGYTALMTALVYKRSELVDYLYNCTLLNDLVPAENGGRKGAMLLTRAIYSTNMGIMRVDQAVDFERQSVTRIKSVPALLLRHPFSILCNLLGIKQLYEMQKLHIQSQELLDCMCKVISESLKESGLPKNISGVYDAITRAVKNGIPEFVFKVVQTHPCFLENKYGNSRSILMLAVLYRQSEIFSCIYHKLDMKDTLTSYRDCNGDNMLHMVGMIEDSTKLNQITGAALQMQRELQWFKGCCIICGGVGISDEEHCQTVYYLALLYGWM